MHGLLHDLCVVCYISWSEFLLITAVSIGCIVCKQLPMFKLLFIQ